MAPSWRGTNPRASPGGVRRKGQQHAEGEARGDDENRGRDGGAAGDPELRRLREYVGHELDHVVGTEWREAGP
jgi:hypothetical protein